MPYIDYFLAPLLKQPELTKEILATTLNISKVAPKLILYGKDKRKWNKQHLKTLTLILCNVVKYHHQDGGVFLYSRQNRKKEPKLFNPNDIGYSSLFWVLDELHKAKLIEDIKGKQLQRGITSQFTITPRLLKLAFDLGINRKTIKRFNDRHVRLRDVNGKKRLVFFDNAYTKYLEELMSRYCKHLNEQSIMLKNDDVPDEGIISYGNKLDGEHIHLYRSFRKYTDDKDLLPQINNLKSKIGNPNFNFYGRSGGYWMTSQVASKDDRETILINGKKTATADFPCSHINLCYRHETGDWLQRETYSELKEEGRELEDAYIVSLAVDRSVIKLLVMMMFNIKGKSAVSRKFNEALLEDQWADVRKKRMQCNYSNLQLIDLVLMKHNKIKDYFLKGKLAGGIIQFEEANLMFNIADQFIREHGITTLTVHDELIVQERYHPMIKDFMYSSGSSEICSKFSLMHKIKHM